MFYFDVVGFVDEFLARGDSALERLRNFHRSARHEFAFGRDYAETLRRWREAFMLQLERVHALGFDHRFVRMWEFYLAYCEAAFNAGCTDLYQYELTA